MKSIKKPIFLVKESRKRDQPSAEYAGNKMAKVLRDYGLDASSIRADESESICNSIIVQIKTRNDKIIRQWKKNGNTVIYWMADANIKYPSRLSVYDAVLFPNTYCMRKQSLCGQPSGVIHQFTDASHRKNVVPEGELKIGYFGFKKNVILVPEMDFIDWFFDRDEWYDKSRFYNCHYSVRPPSMFDFKPNTKIAVAAACRSVFVAARDPVLKDLLSDDYPYYVHRDLKSIQDMFKRISDQFEKGDFGEWNRALEEIDKVAERLSPSRIAQDYVEFLERIGA
jgi:hypothetical protein